MFADSFFSLYIYNPPTYYLIFMQHSLQFRLLSLCFLLHIALTLSPRFYPTFCRTNVSIAKLIRWPVIAPKRCSACPSRTLAGMWLAWRRSSTKWMANASRKSMKRWVRSILIIACASCRCFVFHTHTHTNTDTQTQREGQATWLPHVNCIHYLTKGKA